MDIRSELQTLLPVRPIASGPEGSSSPDFETAIAVLQTELSFFGTLALYAAERICALAVVDGRVQGLTTPVGHSGEPLLLSVSRHFIDRLAGESDLQLAAQLIHAIEQACAKLQMAPFPTPPTWAEAPVLRWLWEFAHSPLYPRGLLQVHFNLLGLLRSGFAAWHDFDVQKNTCDATSVFRRYARAVSPAQADALDDYPDTEQLDELFDALILNSPPPDRRRTGQSMATYRHDIQRLTQTPTFLRWIPRSGGGRRPRLKPLLDAAAEGDIQQDYGELSPEAPARQAFLVKAEKREAEVAEGLEPFAESKPEAETQPRRTRRKPAQSTQPHYRDKWPKTMRVNLTRYTPGVLTTVEMAHALQGVRDMRAAGKTEEADIAEMVFLCGLLNGWTRQRLCEAEAGELPTSPFGSSPLVMQGDGLFVLAPETPVGWPADLIPGNQDPADYYHAVERHDQDYEPVSPHYLLVLHPALRPATAAIVARRRPGRLITVAQYNQALASLSDQMLKTCPNAAPLTSGRLAATFHGYAESLGLDGIDSYVICGHPMKHQEMPLNYTRVSVGAAYANHRHWADQIIAEVWAQHTHLRPLLGWPALPDPPLAGDSENWVATELSDFAGSWSVPRTERVGQVLEAARQQSERTDLTETEHMNWQMRRLAFEAMPLMLWRDFEFENLPLPAGYEHHGGAVAGPAKPVPGEPEAVVYHNIPAFLQDRWWACVEGCAADYTEGPVWCLRDSAGRRLPFNLQTELNRTFSSLGRPDIYVRAYGLRHLGRTLHRQAGMPEPLLNYKMNHAGEGYEHFNPAHIASYRGYEALDQIVMARVAQALGIATTQ